MCDKLFVALIYRGAIGIGKHKYKINDRFFNTDSEELWYFYGMVASDGYVSDTTIEICLNKKDEHILKKFRDMICPDKPIYDKKSCQAKKFVIHSKFYARKIKELFSMTTNKKAFEITLPEIPPQFFKDFVRGCIDGDGCIDTTKGYRGEKAYIGARLRILGNLKFLNQLNEAIKQFVPHKTNAINKKGSYNVWCITYNFSTAKKVLDWCYQNNNICLFRKYNNYKNATNNLKI